MTPPPDFEDAHRRHWDDAKLLHDKDRLENADQLYGFSAECGLKALMCTPTLGMRLDPQTGRPPGEFRKHVHELWPRFKRLAKDRAGWWMLKRLPQGSPFADWSQDDRYARRGYVGSGSLEQHRTAAFGVRQMVHSARRDGIL